jgi:hypothetical protein
MNRFINKSLQKQRCLNLKFMSAVNNDNKTNGNSLVYTKDNVTFYLPRPFHFLSYQSNRLLRRSDLHSKNF